MDEIDDETWRRFSDDMNSIAGLQDYTLHAGEGKVSHEVLNSILEMEELGEVETLLSVMVLLGEKHGANFQLASTEKRKERFVEDMNQAGVNVAVGEGKEHEDYTYYDIYITRDDTYDEEFFEGLGDVSSYDTAKHRRMGEFFGYREEDIEAFLRDNNLKSYFIDLLSHVLPFERGLRRHTLHPEEMVEKYGDELEEREKKDVKGLSFGLVRDSREGFQDAKEIARQRRKTLEDAEEKYGLDLVWLVDSVAEIYP